MLNNRCPSYVDASLFSSHLSPAFVHGMSDKVVQQVETLSVQLFGIGLPTCAGCWYPMCVVRQFTAAGSVIEGS